MWIELPDGDELEWDDGPWPPQLLLMYDATFPYGNGMLDTPAEIYSETGCDERRLEALNTSLTEILESLLRSRRRLHDLGVKLQPRLQRLLEGVMEHAQLEDDGEVTRDPYADLGAFGPYIGEVCRCSPTYIGSTSGEDEAGVGMAAAYCLHWDKDTVAAAARFNAEVDMDLKTMEQIKQELTP